MRRRPAFGRWYPLLTAPLAQLPATCQAPRCFVPVFLRCISTVIFMFLDCVTAPGRSLCGPSSLGLSGVPFKRVHPKKKKIVRLTSSYGTCARMGRESCTEGIQRRCVDGALASNTHRYIPWKLLYREVPEIMPPTFIIVNRAWKVRNTGIACTLFFLFSPPVLANIHDCLLIREKTLR